MFTKEDIFLLTPTIVMQIILVLYKTQQIIHRPYFWQFLLELSSTEGIVPNDTDV